MAIAAMTGKNARDGRSRIKSFPGSERRGARRVTVEAPFLFGAMLLSSGHGHAAFRHHPVARRRGARPLDCDRKGDTEAALRLAVDGGGCSGFTYRFGLAESIDADDIVTETAGVKLVVDPVSIDLVRGCVVDFVDSLGGSSFKVENPNAASGCGCGSSFSI
jgi:iron-sulfur cluster insertion protein